MFLPHIAVVILNYNSEKDLQVSAEQLARQTGVRLSIILVDNASKPKSLAVINSWLSCWYPDAVCGTVDEIVPLIRKHSAPTNKSGCVYWVENNENRGYSSGNNIGIRLADTLNADAVLIANPDMRIEDNNYLKELSSHMFADSQNYIAASRIYGLDGSDQNPLREASFWEEFLWPRWIFRRFFKPFSYVLSCPENRTSVVPKVSGCCLLLRMNFLREIKYLDENVFLYCEEPILSAKVFSTRGRIIYVPMVTATHAHLRGEKGDGTKRMLLFIQSRKYYLKKYSGYNRFQLSLLFAAYNVLAAYYGINGYRKTLLSWREETCA